MSSIGEPPVKEVQFTAAREQFSPLFTETVRTDHPVMVRRHSNELVMMMPAARLADILSSYRFHTDVIPDDEDGGFTLSVRELNIAVHGSSLKEARDLLIEETRAFARDFFADWGYYQHLADKREMYPYVLRIALAYLDVPELRRLLFATGNRDAVIA